MKKFLLIVSLLASAYFGYTYQLEIKKFVLEKYENISKQVHKKQKEIRGGTISKTVQPIKIKHINKETIEPADTQTEETEDLFSDVRDNVVIKENHTDSSYNEPAIDADVNSKSLDQEANNDSKAAPIKIKAPIKLSLLGALRQDGTLSYTKQYEITSEDKTLAEEYSSIQKKFERKTQNQQLSFSELKKYKNELDSELNSLANEYGIKKEQLSKFSKFLNALKR